VRAGLVLLSLFAAAEALLFLATLSREESDINALVPDIVCALSFLAVLFFDAFLAHLRPAAVALRLGALRMLTVLVLAAYAVVSKLGLRFFPSLASAYAVFIVAVAVHVLGA
jgi:hypothetical protein